GGRAAQGLLAAVEPLAWRPARAGSPTGGPVPVMAISPVLVGGCWSVLMRAAAPVRALPRARFPQPDGQPRPRGAVLGARLNVPAAQPRGRQAERKSGV